MDRPESAQSAQSQQSYIVDVPFPEDLGINEEAEFQFQIQQKVIQPQQGPAEHRVRKDEPLQQPENFERTTSDIAR